MRKEELMELMKERRWAYVAIAAQFDEDGFIPSIAIEGVTGHIPLSGDDQGSAPWHWGKSYEECQKMADIMNERRGISKVDAFKIVASTMWGDRVGR